MTVLGDAAPKKRARRPSSARGQTAIKGVKAGTTSAKTPRSAAERPKARKSATIDSARRESGQLGARLRAHRELLGITLRQFARDLDISASFVSQIETDKAQPLWRRSTPSVVPSTCRSTISIHQRATRWASCRRSRATTGSWAVRHDRLARDVLRSFGPQSASPSPWNRASRGTDSPPPRQRIQALPLCATASEAVHTPTGV